MRRIDLKIVLALFHALLSAPAAALEVDGRLTWEAQVLSLPVAGVVAEVTADAGDRVEAGDVLLQLDRRVLQAELARAEAELAEQEEVLAEAERDWERNQELYARTVLSQRDLQLAKNAMLAADARHQAARAAHAAAAWRLEHATLRAPYAGRLAARFVREGAVVTAEDPVTPLFEILAADAPRVRIRLAMADSMRYQEGQEVDVRIGEQSYTGTIDRVGRIPVGQGEASGYPLDIRLALERLPEDWRAGMPARVVLP